MAEVIDRRYLLIMEQRRLRKIHGVVKGSELFFEKYGQQGVDDAFNYMIACQNVDNLRAAEAMGLPMGTCLLPKSL